MVWLVADNMQAYQNNYCKMFINPIKIKLYENLSIKYYITVLINIILVYSISWLYLLYKFYTVGSSFSPALIERC